VLGSPLAPQFLLSYSAVYEATFQSDRSMQSKPSLASVDILYSRALKRLLRPLFDLPDCQMLHLERDQILIGLIDEFVK
jgi:hypothetical protein